jgi:hypothetical protein
VTGLQESPTTGRFVLMRLERQWRTGVIALAVRRSFRGCLNGRSSSSKFSDCRCFVRVFGGLGVSPSAYDSVVVAALEPFESALDEIVRERRELDAAEAAWLSKVGEYARSGAWAADGFLSASAALQHHCRMRRPVAGATVRWAVKLAQIPATAAAFAAGDISRAQCATHRRRLRPRADRRAR